jgi:hypothetical protein
MLGSLQILRYSLVQVCKVCKKGLSKSKNRFPKKNRDAVRTPYTEGSSF